MALCGVSVQTDAFFWRSQGVDKHGRQRQSARYLMTMIMLMMTMTASETTGDVGTTGMVIVPGRDAAVNRCLKNDLVISSSM